jgi:ribose/xylose/arabinose/galactoside ABC-type transport system permease subunit
MNRILARLAFDYGMIFVLVALCGYLSWATYAEQSVNGAAGGRQVAAKALKVGGVDAQVLIVVGKGDDDATFAEAASEQLGKNVVAVVKGEPGDARAALDRIAAAKGRLDVIAATQFAASWSVFEQLGHRFPQFDRVEIVTPKSYYWPSFLTATNLLNIANQTAVRAVIAIGMTMVILTGGIDLSVGSLIALSSVCTALLIQRFGGTEASGLTMVLASVAGIAVCAASGLFSGLMVTMFEIPAFIVTLSVMLIARGVASKLTGGESAAQIPDAFMWLGRGKDLGLPNAVVLMIVLYGIAYVIMSRTRLGRYIYAVGGNAEAARLSGVRVERILLIVYTTCGALAGLGGIMVASLLKSGNPTFGSLAELYVIAAVVVGGTSLSGGEGKILGTLIGALFIGVIENGMNMTNVDQFSQMIVLGSVILAAVLLDTLKKRVWRRAAAA